MRRCSRKSKIQLTRLGPLVKLARSMHGQSGRLQWLVLVLTAITGMCVGARAQEGPLDKSSPKDFTPEQIIQKFAANEKEWKRVREQYTFRQDVTVKTLNGDQVLGDYHQVAQISYNQGKRVRTVLLAPQASIVLSPQDLEDLETRASFTISADELPEYTVTYLGQQKVDELHCYIFDVAPKLIEKGKRYFQGKIWVDDRDLQIVKNTGKSVPDIRVVKKKKVEENLFPQFTTWRQQIEGKFWFPVFSSADDTLHFSNSEMRIKEVLKFTDYKKTGSATGK